MTTPAGQYTAGRIITYAYRDCGLVQEGSVPNSEQIARAWILLQDLVNLWVTQGLKLFLTTDVIVPLTANQNTYTLGPGGTVNMVRPLQIIEGWFEDQYGTRRPLIPLSWDDWTRLSQVNQDVGDINSYFEDKQTTQTIVKMWLTPSFQAALGKVHFVTRNGYATVGYVSLTDTMGFPIEWYIALRWGLADELSTGQPARIVQRCQEKAATYRQALENWDVENAPTQFVPDPRMGYYGQEWM